MPHPRATLTQLGHRATASLALGHRARAELRFAYRAIPRVRARLRTGGQFKGFRVHGGPPRYKKLHWFWGHLLGAGRVRGVRVYAEGEIRFWRGRLMGGSGILPRVSIVPRYVPVELGGVVGGGSALYVEKLSVEQGGSEP